MVTDGLLDFILFAKIIYLEFSLKVSSCPLGAVAPMLQNMNDVLFSFSNFHAV